MVVSLSLSKTGRRLKVDDGCQSELVEDGSRLKVDHGCQSELVQDGSKVES